MNDSTVSGVFNEAKGKLKQGVGETFNDESLANEGAADQLKGNAQQTWGSVKDTAHTIAQNHSSVHDSSINTSSPAYGSDPVYTGEKETGHDIRTSLTNTAEKVKDSIQRGLEHLEHHVKS